MFDLAQRTRRRQDSLAFTDFTLESVEAELGLTPHRGVLFATLPSVALPAWLPDALARGMELALVSEKARSEFIVVPVEFESTFAEVCLRKRLTAS